MSKFFLLFQSVVFQLDPFLPGGANLDSVLRHRGPDQRKKRTNKQNSRETATFDNSNHIQYTEKTLIVITFERGFFDLAKQY